MVRVCEKEKEDVLIFQKGENLLLTAQKRESVREGHGVNFINLFMPSFYARRSRKRQKLLELTVFLRFWGMQA